MPLEYTLAKAARDEADGDLGKARDRLEGLLKAYPDNLEIRNRLGTIYWSLRYPERAGQYWYLLPSTSPDMDTAKAVFARRWGQHPRRMIEAIAYRGGMETLAGTYAEGVLQTLAMEARMSPDELRELVRERRRSDGPSSYEGESESWLPDWLLMLGILLVVGLLLGLVGLGLWTLGSWIF